MEGAVHSVKSQGMKGQVVVTHSNAEAKEEVRLYRGGRLGLASRAPLGRFGKPTGQQFRSTPMVTRRRMRETMSQSQL